MHKTNSPPLASHTQVCMLHTYKHKTPTHIFKHTHISKWKCTHTHTEKCVASRLPILKIVSIVSIDYDFSIKRSIFLRDKRWNLNIVFICISQWLRMINIGGFICVCVYISKPLVFRLIRTFFFVLFHILQLGYLFSLCSVFLNTLYILDINPKSSV